MGFWSFGINDGPSLFDSRGVVKFTMRNGAPVAISPKTLPLQIILCGLLLVLQLVSGEHFTSDLLTEYHRSNDDFDFAFICKTIKKKNPTVEVAFDAIEEEFVRPAGTRVEQLLKSVFFPLLQKAYAYAARKKHKDDLKVIKL